MNSSWISRSRHSLAFSRYSLSPERNRRRVPTISPARNCWLNLRRRIFRTTCGPLASPAAGLEPAEELEFSGELGPSLVAEGTWTEGFWVEQRSSAVEGSPLSEGAGASGPEITMAFSGGA